MRRGPTLDADLARKMDAYWRAANYLSVGQIYLCDNPLLKEPLALAHVKRMLLGHWGTTPGQNFIYTHLNRVIKKFDLNMIYMSGPGHGGPAVVANTYLEGTYSEVYPNISQDEAGLKRLFTQFSFPGGIPSHASAGMPRVDSRRRRTRLLAEPCIRRGVRQSRLIVACVIGDGEAETGPLATIWHSNKFLNPATRRRGAADSASERLQDRQSDRAGAHSRARNWSSCCAAMAGCRIFVEGDDPMPMHRSDGRGAGSRSIEQIKRFQSDARVHGKHGSPALADDRVRLAQGLDRSQDRRRQGKSKALSARIKCRCRIRRRIRRISRSWRAGCGAIALRNCSTQRAGCARNWRLLRRAASAAWARIPTPTAACCCAICGCRISRDYAVAVPKPGIGGIGDTRVLGNFLRDVLKLNAAPRNFRIFGPDETVSNGLEAVFEVTNRQWLAATADRTTNSWRASGRSWRC